jgi:hypothetical protein
MLKWEDPSYAALLKLVRAYFDAPSLKTRLQAIQHLSEATLAAATGTPEID